MIKRKDFLEKFDSKFIYYLVSFFVLNIFIYKKFEINKFGIDDKYISYIVIPSFILGLIATTVYYYVLIKNEKDFKKKLNQDKDKRIKIVIQFILSWMLVTFMFFFFSLNAILNAWLKKTSKNYPEEIIKVEVTHFKKTKENYCFSYDICFKINDNSEHIKIDYNLYKEFENKTPKDYYLRLLTRKTDWNYYIIEDWTIEKKSDAIESD